MNYCSEEDWKECGRLEDYNRTRCHRKELESIGTELESTWAPKKGHQVLFIQKRTFITDEAGEKQFLC